MAQARLKQLVRIVRPSSQGEAVVDGRRIYILPTRYGMVFGVLLVTLLIASINYANNPAFILTFLLTGIFVQAIFHTWRNLLHLHLRPLYADRVFAGETTFFHFRLRGAGDRAHYSLQFGFREQAPVLADCPASGETEIQVPFQTRHRGLLHPGRLIVETRFPLGLLRAWCYVETDMEAIIWPRFLDAPAEQGEAANAGSADGDRGRGTDDFTGYRGYHPGDSLAHVCWKALAGEKGLLVKQFGGDRVKQIWLDFDALDETSAEIRLGRLAGAIRALASQPVHYGLRLGEREIPPDKGEDHYRKCLDALALYGGSP
ncbi:DUF58 domain-containing protein [Thiolapillus sp.]